MPADAAEAREQARTILDGDRYQPADVPRPLEGVLRWIGERMTDLWAPLAEWLSTPRGVAIAVAVVALVTAVTVGRLARRRGRVAARHDESQRRAERGDPALLEAESDRAEAAGDLDDALRLRFRAGVLRLEESELIPRRADATTARLLADVRSSAFAPLARAFDEVAYGGRAATVGDLEAARSRWPQVAVEARQAQDEARV